MDRDQRLLDHTNEGVEAYLKMGQSRAGGCQATHVTEMQVRGCGSVPGWFAALQSQEATRSSGP